MSAQPLLMDCETLALPESEIMAKLPPWTREEALTRLPKTHKLEPAIEKWLASDEQNYSKTAVERAALDPALSHLAVITWFVNGEVEQWSRDPEIDMLKNAFDRLRSPFDSGEPEITPVSGGYLSDRVVMGFGLRFFDLPYLIRRAFILRVPVPRSVFNPFEQWNSLPARFIDVKTVFCAGSREEMHRRISMNEMLRTLGLPEKGNGKDFGKLWGSDREKACEYARNEMLALVEACKLMGLLT